MGIRISGTSVDAEVNSNNELKVALAATQANAGFAALGVEQGAATEPTAARKVRRLKASLNRRLTVGQDTVIMNENFIAAAQNTSLWRLGTTSFTFSYATPGYVVFNASSITTTGAAQLYQSYQHVVLGGQKPVTVDVPFVITAAPPANWQMDFGLSAAPVSTPFALTDGVYLRINSSGLFLVLNYAGTETVSAALIDAANITPNVCFTARLVIAAERTEVWVNDPNGSLGTPDPSSFAYCGALDTPPANPFPCVGLSQPFSARLFHSAAAGAAVQFRLGGPSVTEGDVGQNRPWQRMQARQGLIGAQGQNGHSSLGSTALMTNSLAAGAGVAMTNTTAALGSGLGGQFAAQPTLAAGTDGIVCSYLNPVPTTAIQGRTLLVDGVRIQGLVTTAFTGGPVLYAYSLAFGQTGVSMANAESALGKAPRRIPLGFETFVVTAPVGTLGQSVYVPFRNPIPINPGEYVAVCAKNLGTVTSAGVIVFLVTFDAHWE